MFLNRFTRVPWIKLRLRTYFTFFSSSFNILSAEYKGKGDRFLYPTATDGQIFLSGVEDGNIDIFDATGRRVVQMLYTRGRGLDVAEFEKGIYYVIIGSERFKFVKI